jgi:hypothetical protein
VGRRCSSVESKHLIMIHVFFVPGMFGSTIEYMLRSFSNELIPVNGEILADGSMHSFKKAGHHTTIDEFKEFFESDGVIDVTTPIYPFRTHLLPALLEHFTQHGNASDPCVLMHAGSTGGAEMNMLFQYHKISIGLNRGLDIFCNGNEHNITQWHSDYTHWSQLKEWQLREWISLFYVPWVQEWIESQTQVNSQFLQIENTEFLSNPKLYIDKIFNHCNLTQKPGIADFLKKWQAAQQYIINEFNLLDQIVKCSISNADLEWKSINIIAESIVQQRLRASGYEIQCDGLDVFPTDAKTLYSLLERC